MIQEKKGTVQKRSKNDEDDDDSVAVTIREMGQNVQR